MRCTHMLMRPVLTHVSNANDVINAHFGGPMQGSKTADTSATASENATKGDNATAAGNVTAGP